MEQGDDGRPDYRAEDTAPGRNENLAITALVLGITALVFSAVPVYGTVFALLLGVPAIVLGVLARKRVPTGRSMATGGLVCGVVGLVVSMAWAAAFMTPFFSRAVGSATVIRTGVESGSQVVPEITRPPDGAPGSSQGGTLPPPPDPPFAVEPPSGYPPLDVQEGEGELDLTIDGRERHLELEECDMALDGLRAYLRGTGPDGSVLLQQIDESPGEPGVLLVVDLPDGETMVFTGDSRGGGSSQGFDLFDRRRVEVTGAMQTAFDEEAVDVHLVATCR